MENEYTLKILELIGIALLFSCCGGLIAFLCTKRCK